MRFEVEPEDLLAAARGLRDESSTLDVAGGRLPDVDAGLMTAVIENTVAEVLATTGEVARAVQAVAQEVEVTALDYHHTDVEQAESMLRLLVPGVTETEAGRMARADVVGQAGRWGRLDARLDTREEKLRDFWAGSAPREAP